MITAIRSGRSAEYLSPRSQWVSPDPFDKPALVRQIPGRPGPNRGRRFSDQSLPRYEAKALEIQGFRGSRTRARVELPPEISSQDRGRVGGASRRRAATLPSGSRSRPL
jgi:hypothetical protein